MGRLPKGLIEDFFAEGVAIVSCRTSPDSEALTRNRRDWCGWRIRNNPRVRTNKAQVIDYNGVAYGSRA
jgi:hypothetical protein